MTENLSQDEMMAAMQQSLIDAKDKVEPPKNEEPPKVEPPKTEEPPKVEPPKAEEPPKVEPPKVDPPKNEEPPKVEPPIVQKSFEEELTEKFGGKYKTIDEIKAILEKPEFEFADEKLAHWNELAKKGIKIDAEFIELQGKDYEGITNPLDAIVEAMKVGEFKGLSDNVINLELNKKYNFNEWKDKAEEEMTPEDHANRELLERDGSLKKEWLINYKNERVLEKQEDPKVLEAMAKEAEINQSNWEKFVETDLVNKITKLSSPINDKGETFDFEISENDRKEVGEIMKALTKDPMVFFGQFLDKDDKGNVVRNHAALYNLMLKGRNYEKAIALAYVDAASKEALRIEKEAKNTNFEAGQSGGGEKVYATVQEAQAAAVQGKK